MIEKGRISASQLGKILYMAIIPTSLLTTPAITFKYAKQDLWLSPIWAISGFITVFIVLRIYRMYPSENIIQIMERIGRRIPGKIISGIYLLFILYVNGVIVREYSEFVVSSFLHTTPIVVISGLMVLVCAMAVRGGLEIVGRFAELFLPIFITLFLFNIIPIIADLQWSNLFPIFGEGIRPSIEGAFVLQTWFSEMIIASFFLPFVADHHNAKKTLSRSLLAIMVTLSVSNLATLLLLGELTGNYSYPFLILARYINISNFINHLESLYMIIWVLGAFVKICVFYYVTVLVAAQWMKLSNYQPIVYPLGLLLLLFSQWVAPNTQVLTEAIAGPVTLAMITMFVIIPALLLCIVWIVNRLHN
ncbi:GerAB/ArcD/ProY family transporter [Ureibacillus endophyticus]|uniref:Spore gernimation protein n=1 Tax=Ureibacillus endophyticus TaxID=1978490 RepID=A0A494ZB51_9BACL|nr:endospore germination permease [Lysinibacillus endophyticus]RKQ19322.1 spore gernimation protein [Lysinibacillus endophyticus]